MERHGDAVENCRIELALEIDNQRRCCEIGAHDGNRVESRLVCFLHHEAQVRRRRCDFSLRLPVARGLAHAFEALRPVVTGHLPLRPTQPCTG